MWSPGHLNMLTWSSEYGHLDGHLNVVTWSPECGQPPASVTHDVTCWQESHAPQNVREAFDCCLELGRVLQLISLDGAQKAAQIAFEAFVDLQGDPRKYQTYLATRPKSFEANAVALLIDVLRKSKDQAMKPGFWLHIVHLANADLLQDIKQAQDEGQFLLSMSSSYCCPSFPQLLFAPHQSQ